jgi:hypothetical protein
MKLVGNRLERKDTQESRNNDGNELFERELRVTRMSSHSCKLYRILKLFELIFTKSRRVEFETERLVEGTRQGSRPV